MPRSAAGRLTAKWSISAPHSTGAGGITKRPNAAERISSWRRRRGRCRRTISKCSAQWVSTILGEPQFNDRTYIPGGLWSAAAHYKALAIAAASNAVELGPVGQDVAESNDSKEPAEIALPYTGGRWEPSAPVEITLAKGRNVLHFTRPAPGRGVTIKEFTLKPLR